MSYTSEEIDAVEEILAGARRTKNQVLVSACEDILAGDATYYEMRLVDDLVDAQLRAIAKAKESKMKLVNCTPHDLTIADRNGEVHTFPKADAPARVETVVEDGDAVVIDGATFAIAEEMLGAVIDLPDPADGAIYVVSRVVASHPSLSGRTDVVVPASAPRDPATGKMLFALGAQGFTRIKL